jgi:hypothetical protein
MKKLVGILIVILCTLASNVTYASELSDAIQIENKKITVTSIDEDGDRITTTIEQIPSISRVSKGTYKISKEKKGAWKVSFHVSINTKNQITSASNMSVKAINGSITSNSLTSNSTTATCKFVRKVGTVKSSASVSVSIKNGKLVTS